MKFIGCYIIIFICSALFAKEVDPYGYVRSDLVATTDSNESIHSFFSISQIVNCPECFQNIEPSNDFFKIYYLGVEGPSHTRKASAAWIQRYKQILKEVEFKRSVLESAWIEFVDHFTFELERKYHQQGQLRPSGNRPYLYHYFTLIKSELSEQIPHNPFVLALSKRQAAFKPKAFIMTEIEKVIRPYFQESPYNSPSVALIKELMDAWVIQYFVNRTKGTPIEGKIVGYQSSGDSDLMLKDLALDYAAFYSDFQKLDPQNTFGQKANPVLSREYKLSSKRPLGRKELCSMAYFL